MENYTLSSGKFVSSLSNRLNNLRSKSLQLIKVSLYTQFNWTQMWFI